MRIVKADGVRLVLVAVILMVLLPMIVQSQHAQDQPPL